MPDTRMHRGPHPEDNELFSPDQLPLLRSAVHDLSWLLSKGYSRNSCLKLVGDRYDLAARQRQAVARCACSEAEKKYRASTQILSEKAQGRPVLVDGFNLLTTIEAALGGGVILHARDGCIRDMASVHGSYRHVEETRPALLMIGRFAADLGISAATWYLDRPVSNSGRLRGLIENLARDQNWPWDIQLVFNPDKLLATAEGIIVTSDSGILNRCRHWLDLAGMLLKKHIPAANIVDVEDIALHL
jgi:hypothetical protein